jgi:hypothetical protein
VVIGGGCGGGQFFSEVDGVESDFLLSLREEVSRWDDGTVVLDGMMGRIGLGLSMG